MTIIAYDGKIVAADTLITRGYAEMPAGARKIFPLRKGKRTVVVGFCGGQGLIPTAFLWWLSEGKAGPYPRLDQRYDTDFAVYEKGKAPLVYMAKNQIPFAGGPNFTMGSGDDMAYALMVAAGFSAYQAACGLCRLSSGCGEPVEAFNLDTGKWIAQTPGLPNAAHMEEMAARYKWSPL